MDSFAVFEPVLALDSQLKVEQLESGPIAHVRHFKHLVQDVHFPVTSEALDQLIPVYLHATTQPQERRRQMSVARAICLGNILGLTSLLFEGVCPKRDSSPMTPIEPDLDDVYTHALHTVGTKVFRQDALDSIPQSLKDIAVFCGENLFPMDISKKRSLNAETKTFVNSFAVARSTGYYVCKIA